MTGATRAPLRACRGLAGYTGDMDAEVHVRVETRSGKTRWGLTDDAGREHTAFRPQIGEEGDGADESAWNTAVEAAPWLLGTTAPEEEVPPDDLYEKPEPFKRRVAEDIREGDDHTRR